MTSPLDGKVVPFGKAVDTFHAFLNEPAGDIDTGSGSMPNLRKLSNELRVIAAVTADETAGDKVTSIEDRIYPGIYSTPPTSKPHSGEPSADGDRCVILVDGVPYEHVRVGGGWLIPNVDAQMLQGPSGSGRVGFLQAGLGATPRTNEAKLREQSVTPGDFAKASDDATFAAWAATGNAIPGGTYNLTKGVRLDGSRSLRLLGDVTLDFSGATDAAQFPDFACLYAYGGALQLLPTLDADAMPVAYKGQGTLTFTDVPFVQRGDVLLIYNPTNGSFSGFRTYYRAGEFVPVDSVSGKSVRLFGSLYDSYAAGAVQVYRLPRAALTLSGGRLRVIGCKANGFNSVAAVKVENYSASCLDNLAADGSLYASLEIKRCYNVSGDGLELTQAKDVATGNDYGLVASNSQKVRLDGRFMGGRHAVTTGGGDYVGCVPCRDGLISGFFANSEAAAIGIGAVNNHGNTEAWRYQGVLNGGYSGGGNNNGVTPGSTLIGKRSQYSVAIYMGEMLGFNFALSGLKVFASGDQSLANGRGVIDIGGNSNLTLNANTKFGGTFDLTNTHIHAPDATRALTLINSGCATAEPLLLGLSGLHVQRMNASANVALYVGAPNTGGKLLDVVDMRGVVVPSDVTYSSGGPFSLGVASVSKVRGWSRAGATSGVASTSSNTLAIPVVYDQRAPRTPKISTPSLNRGRTGTQSFNVHISGESLSGFTINITTTDGTNFASAYAFTAGWISSVEE